MNEPIRTDEIQGEIIHEYDGIEEADNELPAWWLAIFYISVVFAAGYWVYYQELHIGKSSAERYEAAAAAIAERGGGVTEQALTMLANDPAAVAAGQQEFLTTCSACHEPKGQGKIGPNLTDDHWIHGGSPQDIHDMIIHGVPEKGMPAWGPVLGPEKVKKVTAFVLSIRSTHVAGKEPEGEVYSGQ